MLSVTTLRNGLYCNLVLQRSCVVRTLPVLCFSTRLMKIIYVLIDVTNIFTFHKKRRKIVWYFFIDHCKDVFPSALHCICLIEAFLKKYVQFIVYYIDCTISCDYVLVKSPIFVALLRCALVIALDLDFTISSLHDHFHRKIDHYLCLK